MFVKCSGRKIRLLFVCCLLFFFQAEDGIRDVAVTGVQTCALPISQRVAAELGVIIVAPDTSPRGEHVPDDMDAAYD